MKQNTWHMLEKAVLETLEDRRMMSASPLGTAVLTNGVLTINGDPTLPSKIMVDYANSGKDTSHIGVYVSQTYKTFPTAQVKKMLLNGGSGGNYIYIDPHITIPSVIHAGSGNDIVRGGGGDNTIYGGTGNDYLHAEGTNNVIYAESGNNTLVGDKSHNTLYAGTGKDILNGGGGHGSIVGASAQDTILNDSRETRVSAATNASSDAGDDSGSSGTNTGSTGTGTTGNTNKGGTDTGNTGSGTSTGSGKTSDPTDPTPTSPSNPNAPAPAPVIQLLDGVRQVGLGVNVEALSTKLNAGTAITAKYDWNFGDVGSRFNDLTGFNASHVYDQPGNYTITLTVTNEDGGVASVSRQITIAASTRQQIFVDSVNGSDSNAGTQNAPLRSLDQAFNMVSDNTEVLLKAGDIFQVTGAQNINYTNVLVGRYGNASDADPIVNHSHGTAAGTFYVSGNSNGVTIENLTIQSPYGVTSNGQAPKVSIIGVYVGGKNIVVRGCQFINIDDAINENGNPTGVLIQDNSSPTTTSLRGYFVWGQGSQSVIVGNTILNSTREHVVRMVDMTEATVEGNTFGNLDRTGVDPSDASKGAIEMHRGSYAYIADNTITDGDIRTGPLGLWGEAATSSTEWCVIADNQLTETMIYVQSGTHHAMIEGNVVTNSAKQAFVFSGVDGQGRTSQDITLLNNTAIDTGTQGNFLRVWGHVDGIVMKNNLWVAPNITPGSYATAAVYLNEANLSSFTEISGNIWPAPATTGGYAHGGMMYVSTPGNGYVTPDQWNALNGVQGDTFQNVPLGDTYQMSLKSLLVGSPLKRAA
jgi:PKD repeat protein